jgi:hypothetical protein
MTFPDGGSDMRLSLVMLAALIASGAAHAQSGSIGFQSPSKNIACAYFDYDKQNTLRKPP